MSSFYIEYYITTEMLPLTKALIIRGGTFVLGFSAFIYIATYIQSSDHLLASNETIESLPTFIWVAVAMIFGPMYMMRLWSKYLFHQNIKNELIELTPVGEALKYKFESKTITGKELNIAWCNNTEDVSEDLF